MGHWGEWAGGMERGRGNGIIHEGGGREKGLTDKTDRQSKMRREFGVRWKGVSGKKMWYGERRSVNKQQLQQLVSGTNVSAKGEDFIWKCEYI